MPQVRSRPRVAPDTVVRPDARPLEIPTWEPLGQPFTATPTNPFPAPSDFPPRSSPPPRPRQPLTLPTGVLIPLPDLGPVPQEDLDRCIDRCKKRRSKSKDKPKPRTECYTGTYVEHARGLSKSRKEKVPCQ